MQNPGRYDMTIYQGATFDLTMTWREGAPPAPVNLTGYSARMQLRETAGSPTAVLSLTSAAGGGITLGGAAGTIALYVAATQTAQLPPGTYLYDLELVNGATVTRLIEGRAVVTPEVTR